MNAGKKRSPQSRALGILAAAFGVSCLLLAPPAQSSDRDDYIGRYLTKTFHFDDLQITGSGIQLGFSAPSSTDDLALWFGSNPHYMQLQVKKGSRTYYITCGFRDNPAEKDYQIAGCRALGEDGQPLADSESLRSVDRLGLAQTTAVPYPTAAETTERSLAGKTTAPNNQPAHYSGVRR